MFRILIEFILLQTLLSRSLSQIEDWNPFDDRGGKVYSIPQEQVPNIRQPFAGTDLTVRGIPGNITGNIATKIPKALQASNKSVKQSVTTASSLTNNSLVAFYNKLIFVPDKFRYKCVEKVIGNNSIYVASNMHSGRYCLLMDVLISCMFKSNRSSGYPVVQFLKEPDLRYVIYKQNSALLMGTETHIFANSFICSFFEDQRIRCELKANRFPALTDIIPTSSFSYQDPNDNSRWILVIDSISSANGQKRPERHFVENGKKILATVPQDYELNATTIYLRHKHYIEGYSFVNQLYYKFYFLTETNYTTKREILTMLWGTNQEFIGCPKAICAASVVDTVIKLKDNLTYVFVGKYYWNLTAGLSVDKAILIDADSPFDTQFPHLSYDIDCSFYDTEKDEAYLMKGQYVYSFTKTDVVLPQRTTPNIYGMHITQVFPGLPYDLNAAFFYRPNSTVYFFRGFHYWGYDLRKKMMLAGYPRLVTDFENMPPNIDAIYSDNFGKYYVFSGTFYAQFTEEQFQSGVKLEFKVSNVDFFGCPKTYFDNYIQFKERMETNFSTVSAKTILDLTNNEGMHLNEGETETAHNKKSTSSPFRRKQQSFLTTFANLLLYGPFFYQLFTEETPHKTKQTIFEAFDE